MYIIAGSSKTSNVCKQEVVETAVTLGQGMGGDVGLAAGVATLTIQPLV